MCDCTCCLGTESPVHLLIGYYKFAKLVYVTQIKIFILVESYAAISTNTSLKRVASASTPLLVLSFFLLHKFFYYIQCYWFVSATYRNQSFWVTRNNKYKYFFFLKKALSVLFIIFLKCFFLFTFNTQRNVAYMLSILCMLKKNQLYAVLIVQ